MRLLGFDFGRKSTIRARSAPSALAHARVRKLRCIWEWRSSFAGRFGRLIKQHGLHIWSQARSRVAQRFGAIM